MFPYTFYYFTTVDLYESDLFREYWTVLLDTYEREDSNAEQKRAVLEAIMELVGKKDDELEGQGEVCLRIVKMFCSDISSRDMTEIRVDDWRMVLCMERCLSISSQTTHTSSAIDVLLNGEGFFDWLCMGIESDDATQHDDFCYLLTRICTIASFRDRTTLSVRYVNIFRKMAFTIFEKKLVASSEVFNTAFFAAFLATDASRFARLVPNGAARECDHIGYCPQTDLCIAILFVLESSVESPKTLEALLGYGLLWVAKHFALVSGEFGTVQTANIFRRILEKFPGWKRQFREWTMVGAVGNPIADLGRSIPPKIATPGVDYVWYEDSDEI